MKTHAVAEELIHNEISQPNGFYLKAAEGWLELGAWREALNELDQIDPVVQLNPFVLEIRYQSLMEGHQWERAIAIARAMQVMFPHIPWGPYHLAHTLHMTNRTQEAYDVLRPVMDQFPKEWLIRFNLACYSSVLGKNAEAVQWLGEAMQIGDKIEIRQEALADPDLTPVWDQIITM